MESWSGEVMGSAILQYSIIPVFHHSNLLLLLEPRENLLGILMKDLLFLFRRQPRDAFNVRPHVIVPLARAGIGF